MVVNDPVDAGVGGEVGDVVDVLSDDEEDLVGEGLRCHCGQRGRVCSMVAILDSEKLKPYAVLILERMIERQFTSAAA